MAKEPTKGKSTAGKRTKAARRVSIRQASRPWKSRLADAALDRDAGPTILVWLVFVLVSGFIVGWGREQTLIAPGDIARDTRVVRVEFQSVNEVQTQLAKENARQRTPRVVSAIEGVYAPLRTDLDRLPRAAATTPADAIEPRLASAADLNEDRLRALAVTGADPALLEAWDQRVGVLLDVLSRNPMLSRADFPRVAREGTSRQVEIVQGARTVMVPRDQVIDVEDAASVRAAAPVFVRNAGFTGAAAEAVASVLIAWATPTHRFDAATQIQRTDEATDAETPVVFTRAVGQVILRRGQVVSPAAIDLLQEERARFLESASFLQIWIPRLAAFSAAAALAGLAAGMLVVVAPAAAARTPRAAWLALSLAASAGIPAFVAWLDPRFITLAAVAPVLQMAVLVVIVYDRRASMAIATISALLVSLTLRLPASDTMVQLLGAAVVAWKLDEIRDRRAIVGASVLAALALFASTFAVRGLTLPMVPEAIALAVRDSLLAGFAGFLIGGVTLFVLPTVERVFDITTGMTLIELRDPKQPLLRELQQRAPGTYNHSLNVASIAEQRRRRDRRDSLLTYVGALYHDVGKMNKPEYFVENQSGGPNKHDRLSPAMSLLVIIGHVKDGVEIAREYGLPRA
jgi:putative nucleotidyltransferase with HDIG domain